MLLNCGVGEDSLRVPWTAGRSNQSILKEISLEYSLEELMLKLKLQYFGHLIQRTDLVKDKENFQNHAFIQSLTHNEEQMSGTRTKNAEGRRNDVFEL